MCNIVPGVFWQLWTGVFCNVVQSLLDNISQDFYLGNVVLRVLTKHYKDLSLCNVVWSLLDNKAQGFYLSNIVSIVLREHWRKFVLVHCCLKSQWQHFLWYLPVQYSPRSIKTTLNKIFPSAMLPGASFARSHKIFTRAMLS